jgi:HSP20 family protein
MEQRESSFQTASALSPALNSQRSWARPEISSRKSAVRPFAVVENDREVAIRAELPGLSETDLSVRCEEGVLYISGGKTGENTEKVGGRVRSHASWARLFTRSLALGDRLDWNHANASFKDGVLTVRLSKSTTVTRSRIEIPIR